MPKSSLVKIGEDNDDDYGGGDGYDDGGGGGDDEGNDNEEDEEDDGEKDDKFTYEAASRERKWGKFVRPLLTVSDRII